MKRPKMPIEPIRPFKPTKTLQATYFHKEIDRSTINLANIIDLIPSDYDPKEILIDVECTEKYGDTYHTFIISWSDKSDKPNPAYAEYPAKLADYKKKLAKYKKDLTIYEEELKKWKIWHHQKELDKLLDVSQKH